MTADAFELEGLLARLALEDELAGPAALMSNVAYHYDRTAGLLMLGDCLEALEALLGLLADPRPVCRREPPFLPIDGGYGHPFGPITVGNKARFILEKLLSPEALREATLKGPGWVDANRTRLKWDPDARRWQRRNTLLRRP